MRKYFEKMVEQMFRMKSNMVKSCKYLRNRFCPQNDLSKNLHKIIIPKKDKEFKQNC